MSQPSFSCNNQNKPSPSRYKYSCQLHFARLYNIFLEKYIDGYNINKKFKIKAIIISLNSKNRLSKKNGRILHRNYFFRTRPHSNGCEAKFWLTVLRLIP